LLIIQNDYFAGLLSVLILGTRGRWLTVCATCCKSRALDLPGSHCNRRQTHDAMFQIAFHPHRAKTLAGNDIDGLPRQGLIECLQLR
jgi:hypothetical protein